VKYAVGCDHAGFPLKGSVIEVLRGLGHEVEDVGAYDAQSSDYPDYALKVSLAVASGRCARGLVVCGSGVGATVAANKVPGIRACLCHDTFSARQGVEDDDMNVVCLGARVIGPSLAAEVVRAFAGAVFSNAERHVRRLNKVKTIEADARKGVYDDTQRRNP
jgi:ribose 5-phosphate isomerase B